MRRLQINFNFSNRAIYTLGIIGFLIIMGCVVYSDWNPSKTTFHPAEDVKINIEGVDYDLQEAVNLGLIGGDQEITTSIEGTTLIINDKSVDLQNVIGEGVCPTGYDWAYESDQAVCKKTSWTATCTAYEKSDTNRINKVRVEGRLNNGVYQTRILECIHDYRKLSGGLLYIDKDLYSCSSGWTNGNSKCVAHTYTATIKLFGGGSVKRELGCKAIIDSGGVGSGSVSGYNGIWKNSDFTSYITPCTGFAS